MRVSIKPSFVLCLQVDEGALAEQLRREAEAERIRRAIERAVRANNLQHFHYLVTATAVSYTACIGKQYYLLPWCREPRRRD